MHKTINLARVKKLILIALSAILLSPIVALAQDNGDDLLNQLAQDQPKGPIYTTAAFKNGRLINMNTTELVAPTAWEFRISHRFGPINNGVYEMFGLDQSSIRLGFDFGVKPWLQVGFGRSSYSKTYDINAKARILRQGTGKGAYPISLVYFGSAFINTFKINTPDLNKFNYRLSYVHQFVASKKFNDRVSLLLAPSVVHYNLVPTANDPNDIYALGFGGRIRMTRRTSLTGEYIYRIPPGKTSPTFDRYYNSFSMGVDIETGGHVFQLHITNSLAMIENGYITETDNKWSKAGIMFGFNVTREFGY